MHSRTKSDAMIIGEDRIKRVDSLDRSKNFYDYDQASLNSYDGIIASAKSRGERRRSSTNASAGLSMSGGRRKMFGRLTLPSRLFIEFRQQETRAQVIRDLASEWRKEEKLKMQLISKRSQRHFSKGNLLLEGSEDPPSRTPRIRNIRKTVFAIIWVHRLSKPTIKKFKNLVVLGLT